MKTEKTVLLVDDDPDLTNRVAYALKEWGYGVVVTCNGYTAHDFLIYRFPNTFCAVVSDMKMPGGSGFFLCSALLFEEPEKVPPVLIHSSELEYQDHEVKMADIAEMQKRFDFVKETHRKPVGGDFGYIKRFLDSIQ